MYNTLSYHIFSTPRVKVIPNIIKIERYAHHSCKILVIGGGTGGCTMAAKLSKKFYKKPNTVMVIEPSEVHYYQPLFTLIGGGIKKFDSSKRPMKDCLPKNVDWLKDKVVHFHPNENKVRTSNGDTVQYELMIIAMGLKLCWDKVNKFIHGQAKVINLPGLVESLKDEKSQVCSIYGPETVTKVFNKVKNTTQGNALFTYPNTPVKCAGAPQKIAYLSEDYWTRKKRRDKVNVIYNTSLPVIFGVKKYADALWDVCNRRNIQVKIQTNLIEIRPDKKEAIFQDLAKPENKYSVNYSFLHVTPPMGPPEVLKENKILTNEAGFLDVNPKTLQHTKFKNIYGLGDCIGTPNSKTMAAIASQSKVVYKNIMANVSGKENKAEYNGYSSCPLVTAPGKCILAEFDYNLTPQETFPVNQGKELFSMYLLKKYIFPFLYWNLMLKGFWNGPETYRKLFSIIKKKETAKN